MIRNLEKTCLGMMVILFISNGKLTAQSQDSMKKIIMNEIVITAFRTPQYMDSAGKSISVIDIKMLDKAVYNDLGELLSVQPGIYISGSGLNPGSSQTVFIRGNNSYHSVIMVDGVRISDPSSVDNGIDISEISLADAGRIEIVRGPQSAMFGSSALGGVINILTRENSQKLFYAGYDTKAGVFNRSAASFTNSLKFGTNLKNGFYFNTGIYRWDVSGFNSATDTITTSKIFYHPDNDDFHKQDIFLKTGFKTKKSEIWFSYKNTFQHIELDKAAFVDDDNRFLTFGRNLLSYGAKYDINPKINVEISGGYSGSKRIDTDDSSVVDMNAGSYIFDHQFAKTILTGTFFVNELVTRYHSEKFRILLGLNDTEEKMNNINYVYSNIPPWGIYESKTDLDSLNLRAVVKSTYIQTALNGKILSWKLKGIWLDLGVRFSNHNKFGNNLTWEVCPSYKVGKLLIYITYGSGYNAPSLYRLYSPDKSFGAITSRGNPNLKPEISRTLEAGLKYLSSEKLHFTFSLFTTTVRELVEYVYLWDKNIPVDSLGKDYMRNDFRGDTYINLSEQKINGIEIGLNYRILKNLSLVSSISLLKGQTTYSLSDIDTGITRGNHIQLFENGIFLSNEEKQVTGLTRRPGSTVYLGVEWYPVKNLSINFENRYVEDRNDAYFNSSILPWGAMDRMNIEGYFLSGLTVNWDIFKNLSAAFKIDNLFNTDYYEINGFNTRKRGFYLRLKYTFEK